MVDSIGVKYQVQFADILKALIKGLHKDLNQVEDSQFALRGVNAEHKVQRGIVAVDKLIIRAANQATSMENGLKIHNNSIWALWHPPAAL